MMFSASMNIRQTTVRGVILCSVFLMMICYCSDRHMSPNGAPPPYYHGTGSAGSGSNGSDSGVSTPDSPKPPRRVIREVVV